jgi:hypothetical protein
MPAFSYWLRTRINPDADTAALQAFANPRADWPWWTDRLSDYVAAINTANPTNRDALITALADSYGRCEAEQTQDGRSWIVRHLGTLFLALFGIIVAIAIFYGLFFKTDFFNTMADINHARGLITFLFAFATIAVIILVAITTFWMPRDDINVRFEKAKDLLTMIIGVLGTILGFYFGSLNAPDHQAGSTPSTEQQAPAPGAADKK